jgi:signal peptidase I
MEPQALAEEDVSRAELGRRRRKLRDAALSQRIAVFLVGPLAALLLAVVLVFFVFFDSSTISGPSMMPTLYDHYYVLATKGLPDPRRGDIVIINVKTPTGPEEWVKRIVGLPGDTVDVRGDAITVNGAPETFPHAVLMGAAAGPIEHVVVPAGRIFVSGDNRPVSEDSRYVGTFALSAVRGRVVFIYAPIEHIGVVPGPAR